MKETGLKKCDEEKEDDSENKKNYRYIFSPLLGHPNPTISSWFYLSAETLYIHRHKPFILWTIVD